MDWRGPTAIGRFKEGHTSPTNSSPTSSRRGYLATLKCKKLLVAGVLPRTQFQELTVLHQTHSWWTGGCLPPPQEPHPRSQPFGPRASTPTRNRRLGPSQHDGLDPPMPTVLLQIHTLHSQVTSLCPTPKQRKPQHTHPRWAGTRKVKPIWILLKQETVSGCGISCAICKSAHRSRQITTPEPHHSVFFTDRMPFLPPNQQCQSTENLNSNT